MIGPIATPTPEIPAQMPMARPRSAGGKTLVRIDSVDGMMNAAPKPWTARVRMSTPGRSRERRRERAPTEDHEPDEQRRLASVAVAGAARDQEEAREDERVRVDDPLQLARRRAELAHEARQRDVDDRAVDADDQQAQTEDREDPPAPRVDSRDRSACVCVSAVFATLPKPSSASRRTGSPRTLTAPGANRRQRR